MQETQWRINIQEELIASVYPVLLFEIDQIAQVPIVAEVDRELETAAVSWYGSLIKCKRCVGRSKAPSSSKRKRKGHVKVTEVYPR